MKTISDETIATIWPRRWLQLAVLALAISGIFSIILVIARTPQLIALVPWLGDLFDVALVIHVDLSVLIWFLAITALFLVLNQAWQQHPSFPLIHPAAWLVMLAGVACMSASPLFGEWIVHKSNYVPVIVNGVFFLGLALAASSMLLITLQASLQPPARGGDPICWGIYWCAPMLLLAFIAFYATAELMPGNFTGIAFYELLFWGGGHLLQFVYTQIMLVAWIMLAQAVGIALQSRRWLLALLAIGPVLAPIGLVAFVGYDIRSQEFLDFFTWQMNLALGIAGTLLAIWLLWHWCKTRISGAPALKAALMSSMLLFVVGGVFGAAIDGPNVKIPAHYHGSIVAVTLALMGAAYALLPKLGGRDVTYWKTAKIQPWLYAVGQLLHISGLAWSGGYGVLRKAVGDTGDGSWQVKAALGMMGGGGLLAISGGLLFVIIMVKGFRRCTVSTNVG